jgi:hypothetical protein
MSLFRAPHEKSHGKERVVAHLLDDLVAELVREHDATGTILGCL